MFEALGQRLVTIALELYPDEDIALGLKSPLYAMDSTTVDLCLSLFPWADFRSIWADVKAHTIFDLRGAIPDFISITTGKMHDVNLPDAVMLPAGSIVVVDRGYLDFAGLFALRQRQGSFVVRAKDNQPALYVDRFAQDRPVVWPVCRLGYPAGYAEVQARLSATAAPCFFRDPESGLHLVFLTNRFDLHALTIAAIYKQRWQIGLFFKGPNKT